MDPMKALSLIKSIIIPIIPKKWDEISRGWCDRSYVQNISLIIIDKVYLLGADQGHILEAIVVRLDIIRNDD
ncbi:hypothetical protein MXB_4406, partial [Myxobolus squamalis]